MDKRPSPKTLRQPAMGAQESKQSAVAVSDQQTLLTPDHRLLLIRGKKAKLKREHERREPSCWGSWIVDASSSFRQRPPPLARLSIDESSASTMTLTDLSSLATEPEHCLIELSTVGGCLQENPEIASESSRRIGSNSSAFQCYQPPLRRKRAFAVDGSSMCRRRLRKERAGRLSSLPSHQASYTSPRLLARRMWLLGEADRYEKEGNFIGARPYLEECCRMDRNVTVNPLAAAYVFHKLGVLTWKIGAYHDSVGVLLKCLHCYDIDIDHPHEMHEYVADASLDEIQGMVTVLITLGRVHISLGELDPTVAYIRKSLDVLKHTMQSQTEAVDVLQPWLARALICMGVVYDARGRSSRAMNTFEKCLQIQRTCVGRGHVDVAATLNRIGGIHEKHGAHDEAMICYTEALRIYRSQLGLGCSPLDVAVTLNNTGFIHHKWKQYDRALVAYREALSIFSLLLGPCHRNITSTKYNIAQAYVSRGSLIRGLQLLKQVLRGQRVSLLGDDHPDVAITLEAIATANEDLGRLSKACSYHEKALRIRIRLFGSKHLLVARTHDQLGQLHSECGRLDSAWSTLR